MSASRARAVGKAAKRPSLAVDVIAANLDTMTLGTFAEADRDEETQGQAETGQKWPFYDPVPQAVRTAERDVQQWCAIPDTELHATQVRGVLKQLNASKRYLQLNPNESVDTAKKSTMCNALLRYYRNVSKRKELRTKARAALEAYRAVANRILGAEGRGDPREPRDPRDVLLQERETIAELAASIETPVDMNILLDRWEANAHTLQQLEDARRTLDSLRRALAPLYLPLPLYEGQPRGWVPPRQSRVGTLGGTGAGSASTTTSQPQGTTVQVNFLNENLKNVTPARVQEMVAALLAQARNPNAVIPSLAEAAGSSAPVPAAAPVYFTGTGNPLGSSKRAKRPVGRTDSPASLGTGASAEAVAMDLEA